MPNLLTGAHCVVLVNGKQYADGVFSFRWEAMTPSKPIGSVDTLEVLEFAPRRRTVSFTVGVYRRLASGGLEGAGVAAPDGYLAREKYVSVMVTDRVSGAVVFQASKAKVERQSWDVETKSFVLGTLSFVAARWSNEVRRSDVDPDG